MRRALLILLVAGAAWAAEFALARPGYRYEFPRDHFAHPQFRTEWWYWTGNLRDAGGRRFGFELTFFRQAVTPEPVGPNPWVVRDVYLAHLTLSDIEGRRFLHSERLNRAGPGLAGADAETGRIWNGNWEADLEHLRAVTETFQLELNLRARKPPVIHGTDGMSRKSEGEGRGSHYVSFTRLGASGKLELGGHQFTVEGTAWMDHEFFSHQLGPDQTGWDWISMQLDNGAELMLFRLRRRDGTIDRHSAGTYVDAASNSRHLSSDEFTMAPVEGAEWRSAATGATYPLRWRVSVPSLGMDLDASTPLEGQEVVSKRSFSPTYWEGAMDYSGTIRRTAVRGVGYLEMTGYDRPVRLGPR